MGGIDGEGLGIAAPCCELTARKLYTSLRVAAVTVPQLLLGHWGSLTAARKVVYTSSHFWQVLLDMQKLGQQPGVALLAVSI